MTPVTLVAAIVNNGGEKVDLDQVDGKLAFALPCGILHSKRNKVTQGRTGEARAAEFLRTQGFRILEQNYRWRGGEIDLVAREDDCLVFVEVKQRRSHRYGVPEAALTSEKRAHIARTARHYLATHPTDLDVRFDVVALSAGEARLHRDAFQLED